MEFNDFNEQLEKRAGKPFYIPEQKELLKYKNDGYLEINRVQNCLNMQPGIYLTVMNGKLKCLLRIYRDIANRIFLRKRLWTCLTREKSLLKV